MARWADVAQVVNDEMTAKGLTQRELAEKSGVSLATLRKLQHGTDQARNRSTLSNVSRALGLPESHLWQVSLADRSGPHGTNDGDVLSELAELRRRVDAIETRLDSTP